MAGVIDSDGCIRVTWQGWQDPPSVQPVVLLGQIAPQAIALAVDLFGGYTRSVQPRGTNARRSTMWSLRCQRAAVCLAAIRPYLRLKCAQADNALAVAAINARPRGGRTFTEDSQSELVTPKEAAKRIGLDAPTLIYNAIRLGMPSDRTTGPLLVRMEHVDQLMAQRGSPRRDPQVTLQLRRYYDISKDLNRVGRRPATDTASP